MAFSDHTQQVSTGNKVAFGILTAVAYLSAIITAVFILLTVGSILATGTVALNPVVGDSMEPLLTQGDVIISNPTINTAELSVGDIIRFERPEVDANSVVHRIVDIKTVNGERVYITKGDNNIMTDQSGQLPPIQQEDIKGEVLLIVNYGLYIFTIIPILSVASLLILHHTRDSN